MKSSFQPFTLTINWSLNMNLTKQAISNNKTIIPGIEGYLTLVSKIEKNVSINPDIAIESCKSLIEFNV